jgi:thiamine-phosphate pyrophosphorylase
MRIEIQEPITYLITKGEATGQIDQENRASQQILKLIQVAANVGVSLVQLREKNLSGRELYKLALKAVEITKKSRTRLLINDRADIAKAVGADGVHLTTNSIKTSLIRRTFGEEFIIGVSTHSLNEARIAQGQGADFATIGPVFDTPSKRAYGQPLGLDKLYEAAISLAPFPLIALGGISIDNLSSLFKFKAKGVAAIRLFNDANELEKIVKRTKDLYQTGITEDGQERS